MRLFEDKPDPAMRRPAQHGEPDFKYLCKSSRPYAQALRKQLEVWFGEYPKEHQGELKQRIVTSETDFDAAFFELSMHALLLRIGASVRVHPTVPGTERLPDFLVELNDDRFYLELVESRGLSHAEERAEKLLHDLYDDLNARLKTPEWWFSIEVLSQGTMSLSAAKIATELESHVAKLEPEKVKSDLKSKGPRANAYTYVERDWLIEFVPSARKQRSAEGTPCRPLGLFPGKFHLSNTRDQIRETAKRKAKYHRQVDLPLVIALNCKQADTDKEDVFEALYRTVAFRYSFNRFEMPSPEAIRKPDGIWWGKDGRKNQHVEQIITVKGLSPWSITSRGLLVHPNPYTDRVERFAWLPHLKLKGDVMDKIDGPDLTQLLGLDALVATLR